MKEVLKVKKWIENKAQFTLAKEGRCLRAHFHKCGKTVYISSINECILYPAAWHRPIKIAFSNPNVDMIHISWTLYGPDDLILSSGIIEADDIRVSGGVFRVRPLKD
jgi:hypothetical protein